MVENRHDDAALDTAGQFERFGRIEAVGSSPLYARLARQVARDPEMCSLAADVRAGQPTPNLLFAAVHYLLLGGVADPLRAYYPGFTTDPRAGNPYPHFRSFCFAHENEVRDLIATRRVQTNAVRRSACLLPAVEHVSRLVDRQPLALVEIGSSAGLNLCFDSYCYEYDGRVRCGVRDSPVRIAAITRGDNAPPLPETIPPIASRVGIDLNPLDVRDPDDVRWLRALIWPEHDDRRRLVTDAIRVARTNPPRIHADDALDCLPDVLAAVSNDDPLCVFNTHVLYQLSEPERDRVRAVLRETGEERPVYWLSFEWFRDNPTAELVVFDGEEEIERRLAEYDPHGRWLRWLCTGE